MAASNRRTPTPANSSVVAVTPVANDPAITTTAGAESSAEENRVSEDHDDIDAGELVEGRVIMAFDGHEPNDLFRGSAEDAEIWHDAGYIDCHPSAVAYAKSLIED